MKTDNNKLILSRNIKYSSRFILKRIKKHKCKICKINNSRHIYKTLFLCPDCYNKKKAEEKDEINKIERRLK